MQSPHTLSTHSTCPQHTLPIPSLRHNSAPQKKSPLKTHCCNDFDHPEKIGKIYLEKI